MLVFGSIGAAACGLMVTCDSDGVGAPSDVSAHEAHDLGKAHVSLQAL